jgi:hypothetical protein
MSWKPIDLAPRDGSEIVAAFRSPLTGDVSVGVVRWKRGAWAQREETDLDVGVTGVAFAWTELPAQLEEDQG